MLKGTFLQAGKFACKNTTVTVFSPDGKFPQEQRDAVIEAVAGSRIVKYVFIRNGTVEKMLSEEEYNQLFSNTNN